MRRRILVGVGLVLLAAGVTLWKCRDDRPASDSAEAAPHGSDATVRSRKRIDPKGISRGDLAGTVRDERGTGIAKAIVCASGTASELPDELMREPTCATTDATGAYALGGLYPARYTISGSARRYLPAVYLAADRRELRLAAGEHRSGIDLVLRDGGVEIAGSVSDLTGGPIAKAKVWAREFTDRGSAVVPAETDDKGAFSVWVKPTDILITASADGYADANDNVEATARAVRRVDLVLTPEASLSGTVVEGTSGQPVEGARVLVGTSDWGWEDGASVFTDERGAFRVSGLINKRYVVVARTENGFGRTEGSVLVGLAQHVDGVVVKLYPARRIEGRIRIAGTTGECEHGSVSLHDPVANRFVDLRETTDGARVADGVLPARYEVTIYCKGYLPREHYEAVSVIDRDATGLVWEVDGGATLHGKVTTRTGEPVGDAFVRAESKATTARGKDGYGSVRADRDGNYEIGGLRPGTYKVSVSAERGFGPKEGVEIEIKTRAEKNLEIDDGGVLAGTVVDQAGTPVGNVEVAARQVGGGKGGDDTRTDPNGAFSIAPLRAGDYLVIASRSWGESLRKPGTNDDAKQGERTAVRAGATATVRIVVESQSRSITGTVVDTAGKPIADAFVSAARESDAAGATGSAVAQTRWSWSDHPVLTSTEGAFVIEKLSAGNYTLRAYRRGGGEAIAEHVAAGGTARLQLATTGSIEGTVRRDGGMPDDFAISIRDFTSGYRRREQFYRTDGHYVLRDLPKGKFSVTVDAAGGTQQIEVELGDGEAKTGVDLQLQALVTVTGRVVELGTTTPVPGIRVFARAVKGGGKYAYSDDKDNISDEAGRFAIKNVAQGQLTITGWVDVDAGYASLQAYRTVAGSGTVDIGDVPIQKARVKPGDAVGELGLKFVKMPPQTPPDKYRLEVSFVDPSGPAAKVDIKAGDVLATIDGIDVKGESSARANALISAPPGTSLAIGLVRGVTVTIVLAKP